MDFKKTKAEFTTISRDLRELENRTGNVYESVMILAKRSNQIASEMKEELSGKLQEFASYTDNLEEVFENREQIEISPRGKSFARARRKLLHDLGLLEHEVRRHGLGPERSALMENPFVDQHERDRLGICLPIRSHEHAESVEDLDEQARARAVHADDDYRA
jgi:DNA-directed RNA polymerase subunit K/omega